MAIEQIFVPENGVISLNLPKLEQTYGTRASRSTQPKFIKRFGELASSVFGRQFKIINQFAFHTKAEVLRSIADQGHRVLIQESVSCAHTMGRPIMIPHCGICSQCVDRRFASIAEGLEEHDLRERYETDIFVDPLAGEGLQQAESHVRAAYRYEAMTADEFVAKYRQVTDALPYLSGTSAEVAEKLYNLHKRAASQTLKALEVVTTRYAARLIRGDLPSTCLIQLAGSRRFRRELCENTSQRIADVLAVDLPLRFRSTAPISEQELQDATEAALQSAGETLQREGPVVPYSVVTTTPDFSTVAPTAPLFVELKLVKDSSSRRYAVKSIGEASSYYVDQGAYALFIVYDTKRWITNDQSFAEPFERKGRVMVRVLR